MIASDLKKIWLSSPHMGEKEITYVQEAFNTNWIAPLGPNVNGFEQDILEYIGGQHHVACLSSGTAAIQLGLLLAGVGLNDLVICQSFTFCGSANPITYLGAVPVFVDSEPNTWNLCPTQLERAIQDCMAKGQKPKAILAVHLYGMPYAADEINQIATHYEIPVVEDSAEALGSTYNQRPCGTLGDFGVFSFNGNKIITTSGGGALIVKTKEQKQRAVYFSTQARAEAPHYEHTEIGYNYRMSNVLAGIGRGQMKVLNDRVTARRKNFEIYKRELETKTPFTFLNEPDGYFSNRWLTCILTQSQEQRERIRLALESENIESRPLWKPMHLQPVFNQVMRYLNGVSQELFEKGLCLPSGSNLTENDLDRVITIIRKNA